MTGDNRNTVRARYVFVTSRSPPMANPRRRSLAWFVAYVRSPPRRPVCDTGAGTDWGRVQAPTGPGVTTGRTLDPLNSIKGGSKAARFTSEGHWIVPEATFASARKSFQVALLRSSDIGIAFGGATFKQSQVESRRRGDCQCHFCGLEPSPSATASSKAVAQSFHPAAHSWIGGLGPNFPAHPERLPSLISASTLVGRSTQAFADEHTGPAILSC